MERKEMKVMLTNFSAKAGKFFLIGGIFILGYVCSDVYHRIIKAESKKSEESSIPKLTKKIDKISVAINERNELMIIDRTDGSYEIYQDSIGRCIFNLYANSIQTKYQNP